MELFRISKKKYIRDLSGIGASMFPGRWNMENIPVIYASQSRALSLLEVLVHLSRQKIKDEYSLARFEVPDKIPISKAIEFVDEFKDFNYLKNNSAISHAVVAQWAMENKSPILKVPSVIVPNEFNYILNPLHKGFSRIRISHVFDFTFDDRLIWRIE